jgi:hypothetical protein
MSFSSWLDTLKRGGYLDDPGKCFDHSRKQVLVGETAGPSKYFGDAWRSLNSPQYERDDLRSVKTYRILADEALECEGSAVSQSITSKELLSAFNLLPVYPLRNRVDFIPELLENFILMVMFLQDGVKLRSEWIVDFPFGICFGAGNDSLELLKCSRTKFVVMGSQCCDFFWGEMLVGPLEGVTPSFAVIGISLA